MSKYDPLIREALRLDEMAQAIVKKYNRPVQVTECQGERAQLERILLLANEKIRNDIIQSGIQLPFDSMLS